LDLKLILIEFFTRILTTPNEESWPGVSDLPDYKPTFPQWRTSNLQKSVSTMDKNGLDLLEVSILLPLKYF